MGCGPPGPGQSSAQLLSSLPPRVLVVATSTFHSDGILGLCWLCASRLHTPQLLQPHSTGWRFARGQGWLERVLISGWGSHWGFAWVPPESGPFQPAVRLVLGVSQCMHMCSSDRSKFLTVLLFVPLVFKPAKGTPLPGGRARFGLPTMWLYLFWGGSLNLCNPTLHRCPLPGVLVPT